MPDFLYVYHGGKRPETPEEGERVMAQWGAWFEGMGADVLQPGNPVGQSYTVSAAGTVADGGANPVSGYSVVRADSMEAALKHAENCPMVTDGSGSVEVTEIIEM